MITWMKRGLWAGTIALAATGVVAQDSTNRVGAKQDWSVFLEENPKECWGVAPPSQTVNTRDGRPVEVRRGEILLFITFRPGGGGKGEVSFTGGYPFASGSTVSMDIGSTKFELFAEGEWAWPSPSDDAKIIAAMKRGANAVLTARSSRGTTTKDTFSLVGFTAAMEDAQGRCAG